MKITKSKLKEIILEELANEQVDDPTKLVAKAATTTQRRKDALARVTDAGKELSSQEAGIVNQIEQYISDLASKPGIDLVQHPEDRHRYSGVMIAPTFEDTEWCHRNLLHPRLRSLRAR